MNLKGLLSKSFCWGILVASLTWIITIILYLHLVKEDSTAKATNTINSSSSIAKKYTIPNIHIPLARKKYYDSNKISFSNSSSNSLFKGLNLRKSKSAFINSLGNYGVIRDQQDQYVRDIGYKQHAFNALVSNNIGLFRDIPDTRHKVCSKQTYDADLPQASIIMCFFNEHQMTLLRSVKTIFERTPKRLLKEIILVDDYSDHTDLQNDLVEQMRKIDSLNLVRIIRNTKREGLIRARVIGARNATGDVIVFLDSHIEVNKDWIEPLLHIIKHENSTLAVPVIDIINADTFQYNPSPLVRGGFNWGLHFKWENLPEGTLKDESSFSGPFISPTMAGGLFAVNREYFRHIGEYDMGMDIWGGENIEISFRAWQCGGAIKIIPCSRVGHIFRKRRPYSSPDGSNTMLRNSLRLAYVWMDEFKNYFLEHEKVNTSPDYGDIDDRIELRNKLKCKNFSWYLKNVYPELNLPGEHKGKSKSEKVVFQPWHSRKRTYTSQFMIKLSNTDLCISVVEPKVKGFWKRGSTLSLMPCVRTPNQIWFETERSELVLDKLLCMEADSSNTQPILGKCHEMLGDQQWRFTNSDNTPIYNMASGTCLRANKAAVGAKVALDLCTKDSPNMWDIVVN